MNAKPPSMSPEDLAALRAARGLLENPGLIVRLSNYVGSPLEGMVRKLPASVQAQIGSLAGVALQRAMATAANTLGSEARRPSPLLHKVLGSVSGGVGGAFGLGALAVEIPLSTTLIMRSILDTARAQGEDIKDPATRLAALEVFALGGPGESDNAAESGYYAIRAALASAVGESARHLASKGLGQEGAPALLRLLAMVAARYKIQLSQKAAGMLVPGIGAAAGATINLLFMSHFQDMSEGHFTVRRLERIYGRERVQEAYRQS